MAAAAALARLRYQGLDKGSDPAGAATDPARDRAWFRKVVVKLEEARDLVELAIAPVQAIDRQQVTVLVPVSGQVLPLDPAQGAGPESAIDLELAIDQAWEIVRAPVTDREAETDRGSVIDLEQEIGLGLATVQALVIDPVSVIGQDLETGRMSAIGPEAEIVLESVIDLELVTAQAEVIVLVQVTVQVVGIVRTCRAPVIRPAVEVVRTVRAPVIGPAVEIVRTVRAGIALVQVTVQEVEAVRTGPALAIRPAAEIVRTALAAVIALVQVTVQEVEIARTGRESVIRPAVEIVRTVREQVIARTGRTGAIGRTDQAGVIARTGQAGATGLMAGGATIAGVVGPIIGTGAGIVGGGPSTFGRPCGSRAATRRAGTSVAAPRLSTTIHLSSRRLEARRHSSRFLYP